MDTGIVDQCVKYLNNLLGTPGAIIPGGNQGGKRYHLLETR